MVKYLGNVCVTDWLEEMQEIAHEPLKFPMYGAGRICDKMTDAYESGVYIYMHMQLKLSSYKAYIVVKLFSIHRQVNSTV